MLESTCFNLISFFLETYSRCSYFEYTTAGNLKQIRRRKKSLFEIKIKQQQSLANEKRSFATKFFTIYKQEALRNVYH